jgi:hypothetical protein
MTLNTTEKLTPMALLRLARKELRATRWNGRDGITCPFTHRGYETAVRIDLKDDVGSTDLVVGQ